VADRSRFSLASARRAADEDRLAEWVGELLASPGSDNAVLAAALAQREHWWWGPLRVPVDDLVRLAGPEDDALVPVATTEWEGDVEAMADSLDDGWEPPPLLAEWQQGELLLQDGNHRYEALARDGAEEVWVLVYADNAAAAADVNARYRQRVTDPAGSRASPEEDGARRPEERRRRA
jgi:hypothetical protein